MGTVRVGVTGARKAPQLAAALERRGLLAVVGPLVTTDLPADPAALVAATEEVVAAPPEWLAASTGVGMRLWFEVAGEHGLDGPLREALASARRVARGAKAAGALVAAGLAAEHVTDEEVDAAVVAWLAERASPGQRVVAQLHGSDDGAYAALADRGLEVLGVQPYVAGRRPHDEERARDLVRAVASGGVDVVTLTSPGAARNLFALADELGLADEVRTSLAGPVAVAVVGPVTAAEVLRRGLPVAIEPARHRQGDLVRAVAGWAAGR